MMIVKSRSTISGLKFFGLEIYWFQSLGFKSIDLYILISNPLVLNHNLIAMTVK